MKSGEAAFYNVGEIKDKDMIMGESGVSGVNLPSYTYATCSVAESLLIDIFSHQRKKIWIGTFYDLHYIRSSVSPLQKCDIRCTLKCSVILVSWYNKHT